MIYFIQTIDNQFTKIGKADDPIKRLASLQTGIPYALKLFAVAPGDYEEERECQLRFVDLLTRGEWHRTTEELTAFAVQRMDALAMARLSNSSKARMFFETIAPLETRLLDLYARAAAIQDNYSTKTFCANAAWYGYNGWFGIKPDLLHLVGWEAHTNHPELRTPVAYSAAYRTIYETLPHCRDCICA